MAEIDTRPRLTQLVKCAGCAAKIGPAQLSQLLRGLPIPANDDLLVGLITGDDAGVVRISESTALVQTLDFFTPIVDDPYQFGQIAAANALSDVYAMGGRPLTAMNIVCFPIVDRGPDELREILRGGAEKVAEAEAMLVGGHSIDDPAPKFGLSVTGLVNPQAITTNAGAQPGDMIVLTKRLGTGIITTAAKFDECPIEVLHAACASMSTLNRSAAESMIEVGIGPDRGIHAATDITGFSLLGHLFHLCRASGASIRLDSSTIPLLPEVPALAAAGNVTRGGKENAGYLSNHVTIGPLVHHDLIPVLYDPQTSGGLAIFVSQPELPRLLDALERRGVSVRAVIGTVLSSPDPMIWVD